MSSSRPVRLVVADEDAFYRAGVRHLMAQDGSVEVVADCRDEGDVVPLVVRHHAEVVLTGVHEVSCAGSLAEELETVAVLMIVDEVRDQTVVAAVSAGVAGVVRRDISATQMAEVVHQVVPQASGAGPVSLETLTAREREVVRAAAQGISNRKIARELDIAEQTVKNHLHNILVKLGLSSRTELCRWALLHAVREGSSDRVINPTS